MSLINLISNCQDVYTETNMSKHMTKYMTKSMLRKEKKRKEKENVEHEMTRIQNEIRQDKKSFYPKILLTPCIFGAFDIVEYLNSLPTHTIWIDVSNKGLMFIPDLSRFKYLQTLICVGNQLTSLPPFNPSLERVNCRLNHLTSLPPLNKKLLELNCDRNELTYLPPLNTNLKYLDCSLNKITYLPKLNKYLKHLNFYSNDVKCLPLLNNSLVYLDGACNYIPSTEFYNCKKIFYTKKEIKKINICNRFRELYYILKYKKRFLHWLLKSREKQIQEQYHPKHLLDFIEKNPEADNEILDEFLKSW